MTRDQRHALAEPYALRRSEAAAAAFAVGSARASIAVWMVSALSSALPRPNRGHGLGTDSGFRDPML
jgi:hypothetical protein